MEKNDQVHDADEIEMRNIIEEARVARPAAQALFGFQGIAVFVNRFEELPAMPRHQSW